MSAPQRSARQRSPSNLGSNNHPLREKGCATSVASMGETHLGHAVLSGALALEGTSSFGLRFAISLRERLHWVYVGAIAGPSSPVFFKNDCLSLRRPRPLVCATEIENKPAPRKVSYGLQCSGFLKEVRSTGYYFQLLLSW